MKAEELLKHYAAGARDFTGVDLSEIKLMGVNLAGVVLREATLNVANLTGSNLSQADLSGAKLNVARLSGANLSQSNLSRATLNVANLIRVIAPGVNLNQASLVRTELIRAELSGSNLQGCNLSDADLRETRLRHANLTQANLSQADLRGCVLTSAYLTQANLHAANLNRANLQGADLREAELRHANLNRANLAGANLSGANLRWADLSGADLRWADLSGAKLSGATLVGANLANANLSNASFVHADLTQASLIQADWIGADLTGVTLTGAKLYGVPRFRLTTDGIVCDWIDLSPNGDQSQVRQFPTAEEAQAFFSQVPPTVQIVIDTVLSQEANYALAAAYYRLAQQYATLQSPPNLEISYRRTTLTFRARRDEELFAIAGIAILPFQDAAATLENVMTLAQTLQAQASQPGDPSETAIATRTQTLCDTLLDTLQPLQKAQALKTATALSETVNFMETPVQITVTNSQNQSLLLYQNPRFGKRLVQSDGSVVNSTADLRSLPVPLPQYSLLPSEEMVLNFIQGFAESEG